MSLGQCLKFKWRAFPGFFVISRQAVSRQAYKPEFRLQRLETWRHCVGMLQLMHLGLIKGEARKVNAHV